MYRGSILFLIIKENVMSNYNAVLDYIKFLNVELKGKSVNDVDPEHIALECSKRGIAISTELNCLQSTREFVKDNLDEFVKDSVVWDEYLELTGMMSTHAMAEHFDIPREDYSSLEDLKDKVLEKEKGNSFTYILENMFNDLGELNVNSLINYAK